MSRTADISIAVPAYEPWRPATEDRIAVFGVLGDPKDPSTSLDSGWGICQKPMLGPLFFSKFVEVTPVTEGERTTLQEMLGVEITDPAKEKINNAIQQITTHVALKDKLPNWKRFEERQEGVILAVETLLMLFDSISHKVIDGLPSVDQTLGAHIALLLSKSSKEQKIPELTSHLRVVLDACKQVLHEIKSRKSMKGPKTDVALDVFCNEMIDIARVAKADITLPSPRDTAASKEGATNTMNPSFLKFVQQVIELAAKKGSAALESASLTDEEKRAAMNILNQYKNKTRRTLADDLRAAMADELSPNLGDAKGQAAAG
jgi:hypothetical protein